MILTDEKKKMSLEEFLQLTEVNVELIDGYLVQEPTPTYGHQTIVVDILTEIKTRLRQNKKGEVVTAPMDVFLEQTVVQPDILFISSERLNIIKDGKIKGAPDVVFEIISPSNAHHDLKTKFDIYENHGVKEYFIVYPEDKTVVKYVLTTGKYHEQYRETAFVQSTLIDVEFNF